MPESELAGLFLKEYVRYLIYHSKKVVSPQTLLPHEQPPVLITTPLTHPSMPEEKPEVYHPSMTTQPLQPQIPSIRRPLPPRRPMPMQHPSPFMPPRVIPPQLKQPQLPPPLPAYQPSEETAHATETLGLTKLSQFLADSGVMMIECAGPDKAVVVTKGGVFQTTSTTLNVEEIDSIMKEISEKTKIPIVPGIFKAALGNLLITAVVSEFVGTRFIIQKRGPR
ncbi:hypothetical protein KW805_01255 [Candidatus Pacearchaeota archaeon]|nr:hypothetical protein [Candidatus Pacearchaeota archaeon]